MNQQRGFTVLEFCISIIIIFVVIVVIVFFLSQANNRAADASIRQLSTQFRDMIELYRLDHDRYGGHTSGNTFVCDSESTCQWGQSFVNAESYPKGYEHFKLLTDEFETDSWSERDNHRIYFGSFGQTYAVVINLRTDTYWCFDWQGQSGIIDTWPEFDANRNVSCSQVRRGSGS